MHVDSHESENYFGHAINAEYRSLQTWHRTNDGWKLIGAQVYASLIESAGDQAAGGAPRRIRRDLPSQCAGHLHLAP